MLGFDDKNLGCRYQKTEDREKVMSPAISPTVEAKMLMRESWPPERYGKLDNVFYHARKFIRPRVQRDFTIRRARSIWEGTARRIDADEMDALRQAKIEEMKRAREEARALLAELDRKIAMADAAEARRSMARTGGDEASMG